ncbi:hypothetical protein SK128_008225 [Halocaridina rubra]|uniref:Major facilitator superfamily (MFS) profile domain-containing protein n=1 Tax=Halocaridina rubra TaxID=373956 RepID=A0AAN8XKF6_HALRR
MLIAGAASTCYMSLGMVVTWPNVLVSHLLKSNSTLLGKSISLEPFHMDMAGSMMFIGSIPGYLLAGWLMSSVGRRWSIFIGALPSITGAALIGMAVNPTMIITGRFLDGITFGMMNVSVRSYIAEISDSEVRGRAGCIVNLTMQIGSILAVGLGILMAWYYVALIYGCILIMHCILVIILLPESPAYLAVTDKDERAIAVLSQLRGPSVDAISELKQLKTENQQEDGNSGYRSLLKRDMLQRMFVIFGLFFLCNFAGVQVLKANVSRILQAFGLPFKNEIGAVIVICLFLFGSFTMMCVLDFIGRRHVLMISLNIIAVSYGSLGAYVYFVEQGPHSFVGQAVTISHNGSNSTVMQTTHTRLVHIACRK